MGHVYFDTLKFAEALEKAGMPAEQARAISSAIKDAHEAIEVATKNDLHYASSELKRDILSINEKIDHLIFQVTFRLGVIISICIVVVFAIIKMNM
ncbi:TPA: DUF1640 domain-containing protein [Escherichia coli]|uniref:DUF1640 domain-containing protein n=1 Tax=Escherichia coli TaxID=562 RepID=A0A6D0Y621_ECOLX|nr:hypothetical protein [Escherichia coli]EEG9468428.1 DUF1640 domain-containing protein [Escherichia coli]EES7474620.1 DUF1640 domain-containing protein [Escherichia coli]EEV9634025.1 DUF1640 domain-containing protein [Escherichia coli]EEY1329191.1 DUF1640 domain-containing protein [Escherichia coli]EFA1785458.1 DUF1640 domain-containing protein [Escherichia coli]